MKLNRYLILEEERRLSGSSAYCVICLASTVFICNPRSAQGVEMVDPGALWPRSLEETVNFRLMKTMSEKIRWKAHRTKLDLNVDFWPSHAYTQTTTTTHTHNIHTYKYTRMYRHKIFEAIQYNLYMSIPISKTSWLDRNLTTKVK